MSTFNFAGVDSTLNLGSYNGGTTSVSSSGSSVTRNASNVNLTRVSRDLAAGYSQNIAIIEQYINGGDISKAMEIYNNMYDEAQVTANNYGYSLTDSQIASIIDSAYSQQTGETFTSSVSTAGKGSFATGVLEGIPLVGLLANSYSNAEALSEVSGTETKWTEKFKEAAGAFTSGAATGAAIGSLPFFGGPGLGTAIGAVVGGVVGFGQSLLKQVIG